ncbi:hypothetical protein [Aquibacillus saliphilus]|uniref:hypothetical protein n=1 Tax=Aquibacillus saliphilus TaxID=1909422 RepID=UPI001CF03568|nr:hypothetical protein [Aquibacillus saliphilus]
MRNRNNEKEEKRVLQKKIKRSEHEFSEELSDGGERDKIIKSQSPKNCGGL